jgi:uncharacterized protein YjdB
MTYPANPRPGVVTTITVSPATVTLTWGQTQQLTPTLTDVDGNPIEATEPSSYSSSNTGLLTVDASGLCTVVDAPTEALAPGGVVTVKVSYPFASGGPGAGKISAEATIAITPTPGQSVSVNLLFANQYGVTSQCPARVSKIVPQS